MKDYKHYPSTKMVQGRVKLDLNNSPTYEGYLEKKARNIFSGWQKRYFIFLENKIIIYTESKESKQVKGYISIKQISSIKSLEGNTFSIEAEGRTFLLRAENQDIKNNWIEKIKSAFAFVKKGSLNDNSTSLESKKLFDIKSKNEGKAKINSISIKLGNLAKKYGYILNKEDNESKLLLEKFGINKLINLNDKKIIAHIHYGFMFKRQRLHDTYNQRWFFIFSRGCLQNNETNIDNNYLEDKKQKEWLKYDTLYYFKTNKDKDKNEKENGINIYEAGIKMEDCHKIINFEKNGKYFMNLDYKERIYELYCETKFERDEWFETLINSRKTAKTYKYSITKHPKNVDDIYNIFIKDKKLFIEKIKSELISVTGKTEEITEFDLFQFTINNLQNHMESYMDGCICSLPMKIELLKSYVDYMNKEYLNIYKKFWEKSFNTIANDNIIKMGLMLLKFYDRLNIFNVDDVNLLKNGKELVKIYFKSIFPNILFSIENTIKYEIEHKGTPNKEGLYCSEGPKILFDTFWKIFDIVKDFKHKIIFDYLIKILNISIFQYCFGINCVISNRGIIIEDEYLITVCNDTLTINELLYNFMENYKNLKIYTEEEINEKIQIKKLIGNIDKLNNNAIIHLVYEHKDELEKEIEKQKFLKMDLVQIIKKSAEIYAIYKPMMNNRVSKIFFNEILKLTLCYYITKLLLINKKNKKEDIISKVKKDKEIFIEAYTDIIGQNLTNSTLLILDYITGILESDKMKISSYIIIIRQYIGPAFTYSVAKKLIKLRSDLSKEDKRLYKNLCEEVLNGYVSPKEEPPSYYQILSSKIKKNDKDKEYLKIRASQFKFGNEIVSNGQLEENELYEDNNIEVNNINNNNNSDMEEEIRSSIAVNITNDKNYIRKSVVDFIEDNDDLEEENEEEEEENEIKEDLEEDKKPDYEGVFYKKRTASFAKYFYQIKNCGLYWFEEQASTKPKNKLSLENITIVNSNAEPYKFSLKQNSKGRVEEYKFKCNTQVEKNNLINAITKAKNESKEVKDVIQFPKIEIKERKKVIKDLKSYNKVNDTNIEDNIFEFLKTGQFFKIDKKKMEKAIKNNIERKQSFKGINSGGDIQQKKSIKLKIKKLFKGK